MAAGQTREQAEIAVLGTPTWRLGQAVAEMWKFPQVIVEGMAPVLDGGADVDGDPGLLLRYGAGFANAFVDAVAALSDVPDDAGAQALLHDLMGRFPALAGGRPGPVLQVLELSQTRFADLAPTLDVSLQKSPFLVCLNGLMESLGHGETLDATL